MSEEKKKREEIMAKPEVFELSNGTITVNLTNVGAAITSLLVPDAQGYSAKTFSSFFFFLSFFMGYLIWNCLSSYWVSGNLADVVLGFDSLDTYIVSSPNFAAYFENFLQFFWVFFSFFLWYNILFSLQHWKKKLNWRHNCRTSLLCVVWLFSANGMNRLDFFPPLYLIRF